MDHTRTITIHIPQTAAHEAMQQVGVINWERAIGYLSTWAMHNPEYQTCEIHQDFHGEGTDMVAVYKDADGTRRFVIGAVWHDDHYGFHS